MPSKKGFIYLLIVVAVSLSAAGFIVTHWSIANAEIDTVTGNLMGQMVSSTVDIPREKIAKQTVKGIYLTAYSANNATKLNEMIKLIDATELNAVVIDIKDYTGYVLYDSKVPLVEELKTKRRTMMNVPAIIRKLHAHNIYVIARQTVFQDPILASKKPEWAIKSKSGGIWRDKNGLSWVDATKPEVWDYNMAIAKEASALGFDEINFDYVRFPSDGNMSQVVYSDKQHKKYEIMHNFYSFVSSTLAEEPVWTSFDMFGFVMEKKGADDMNIGQRLADAVDNTDYVCPMMYPSHYPSGHLGLENPAAFPGKVLENGLKKGMPVFENKRAEARPWIQAFNIGAVYNAQKIREEINAVEKHTSAGWLMWNAANRYSTAGLKLVDQNVGG